MNLLSSGYYDGVTLDGAGISIFLVLLAVIVLIAVGVNVVPRIVGKWKTEYKTRDLTYGAVCLALSYGLSWIGISLPLGGTLTIASLLPIYIYCYYFGFRKGSVLSAAYLFMQFTQKIYIVHPLSVFFDYILPYFSLCVVGLFRFKPDKYAAFIKKNKTADGVKGKLSSMAVAVGGHRGIFAGAAVHAVIRYLSLVISGVLCWDYWGYEAAEFSYKLTYSLGYNSFALIDSVVAIVAAFLVMLSKTFNMFMTAGFSAKKKAAAATADMQNECAATDEENDSESEEKDEKTKA